MTPNREPFLPRGEPRRLLPGLEYARSLIETAILICQNVEKEPLDERELSNAPTSTKGN